MIETTKKCPMCAEEIKAEARVCRFCGAKFNISIQGYCEKCHQMRDADENNNCRQCGTPLVDIRSTSEYIKPGASVVQTTNPGSVPVAQAIQPPKKKSSSTLARIVGSCILVVGFCFIASVLAMPKMAALLATPTPVATRTPWPTSTPTVTATLIPTHTSTPMPADVNFTSIHNYPTGSKVSIIGDLVLPSRTNTDVDCFVNLRNPADYSVKIPIFIYVPKVGNTPSPNQMERLPNPYRESDFKVRLHNGTYVGNYATVRITGTICETTDGDLAICEIFRIEPAQ